MLNPRHDAADGRAKLVRRLLGHARPHPVLLCPAAGAEAQVAKGDESGDEDELEDICIVLRLSDEQVKLFWGLH